MILDQTTDREAIRTLEDVTFEGEEALTPSMFQRSTWWIAYDRDRPVGYAGVYIAQPEGWAVVEQYGVIHEARGKGVGRLLLHRCAGWAREQGVKAVTTYTMPWNIQSGRCLAAAGFRMYAPVWSDQRYLYWWRDV